MSRDHTKLGFFTIADDLALNVYAITQLLPVSERFGLQSQLRRAAVSTVTNIVEGATRRSGKAYMQFLETSLGSACEARYLLQLCVRLKLFREDDAGPLIASYTSVVKAVQATISTIAADSR
jgi:four helix bundle protein